MGATTKAEMDALETYNRYVERFDRYEVYSRGWDRGAPSPILRRIIFRMKSKGTIKLGKRFRFLTGELGLFLRQIRCTGV